MSSSLAQRVATRFLTANFKPGEYILYGKFKNKKGRLKRIFLDDRGIPYIEIEPYPNPTGRKKNRVMGLYTVRKMKPEVAALMGQP